MPPTNTQSAPASTEKGLAPTRDFCVHANTPRSVLSTTSFSPSPFTSSINTGAIGRAGSFNVASTYPLGVTNVARVAPTARATSVSETETSPPKKKTRRRSGKEKKLGVSPEPRAHPESVRCCHRRTPSCVYEVISPRELRNTKSNTESEETTFRERFVDPRRDPADADEDAEASASTEERCAFLFFFAGTRSARRDEVRGRRNAMGDATSTVFPEMNPPAFASSVPPPSRRL